MLACGVCAVLFEHLAPYRGVFFLDKIEELRELFDMCDVCGTCREYVHECVSACALFYFDILDITDPINDPQPLVLLFLLCEFTVVLDPYDVVLVVMVVLDVDCFVDGAPPVIVMFILGLLFAILRTYRLNVYYIFLLQKTKIIKRALDVGVIFGFYSKYAIMSFISSFLLSLSTDFFKSLRFNLAFE